MSEDSVGATCLLVIGDRVALRADGPPEAEYAMFEIGEIELRASGPGRVREFGYQTTAELALGRLADLGFTAAIAREIADAMQPVISMAYSRGIAVRRVAHCLGPRELLQSDSYAASARAYRGVFLDLATLANDLRLEHANATLHALYLATLLEGEPPTTTVSLSTDACTRDAKPGARTYRRPSFADARRVYAALSDLASRDPRPAIFDVLPRADVIAFLRERGDAALTDEARSAYAALEGHVSLRDRPHHGPLSEPDLWAIETRLETGDHAGIVEAIEHAEQRHGRTPGTTYLRARAALVLRLEPAPAIAERVTALALSMNAFHELGLLAAEAWLDADEPRRALPFARDLVAAPGLDETLLLRAQRLVARAVGAAPAHASSERPLQPSPSSFPTTPPVAAADPPLVLEPPDLVFDAPALGTDAAPTPSARSRGAPRPAEEIVRIPSTVKPAAPTAPSLEMPEFPVREPPAITPKPPELSPSFRAAPVPPAPAVPIIEHTTSFTLDLPGPEAAPPRSLSPAPRSATPPPRSMAPSSRRPRLGVVTMESMPPSFDPRAEPDGPPPPRPAVSKRPSVKGPRRPSPVPAPAPARPPSSVRPDSFVRDGSEEVTPVMQKRPAPIMTPERPEPSQGASLHGASLPPFEHATSARRFPRRTSTAPGLGETAEYLSLPPGVGGQPRGPGEPIPAPALDVRVEFTQLSRELGRDYRVKHGIELRADVTGVEAMQSVLLEAFPDRALTTKEHTAELRRHGAFLSEILIRRLDAQWLDFSPDELGYWAMIVPPDTRVWPFGRIARFIQMGHKERDLVSYFLELESRAKAR